MIQYCAFSTWQLYSFSLWLWDPVSTFVHACLFFFFFTNDPTTGILLHVELNTGIKVWKIKTSEKKKNPLSNFLGKKNLRGINLKYLLRKIDQAKLRNNLEKNISYLLKKVDQRRLKKKLFKNLNSCAPFQFDLQLRACLYIWAKSGIPGPKSSAGIAASMSPGFLMLLSFKLPVSSSVGVIMSPELITCVQQ